MVASRDVNATQKALGPKAEGAFVAMAVALLSCARLGPAPFRKVWAEDGSVFLADFSRRGWRSVGYVYTGYLSVPSRVVASTGAALLPVRSYAVWCALASVVVAGALAAFVFTSAKSRVGWWALAPSLGMALIPALRGESLGNLANLQVFLIPAACWAMPEQQVTGPIVALAAALASPLAVFALPLLAVRRAARSVVALCAGLVVQVIAKMVAPRSPTGGIERSVPSLRALVTDAKLSGRYAVGNPDRPHLWIGLAALAVVVTVVIVWAARARPVEAYLFAGSAVGLAVLTIASSNAQPRYLVAPSLMLVSAFVFLDVPVRIARGAVIAAVVLVVCTFGVSLERRSGPRWRGRACVDRVTAVVTFAPDVWGGKATLRCSGLR